MNRSGCLRVGGQAPEATIEMPEMSVVIDPRYNGPPESANGGYACGLLARELIGAVEVTLRAPPPLGRDLRLSTEPGRVALFDGDQLVAEARPAELDLEVPPPPDFDSAKRACAAYAGFQHHIFPTCFVCGPERKAGDGLRIFAGPVADDSSLVASPWSPDASFADTSGIVRDEFVWAALDCPGAFAIGLPDERLLVLGRLTGVVEREVGAGERYVVAAWAIGHDGRKHFAGSAVLDEAGNVCARGRATWIELG
jgi:hypothetical protein